MNSRMATVDTVEQSRRRVGVEDVQLLFRCVTFNTLAGYSDSSPDSSWTRSHIVKAALVLLRIVINFITPLEKPNR